MAAEGANIDDENIELMTDDDDEGLLDDDRGAAYSRGGGRAVATTWQDVDRGAIAASALALVSSVAQTAPADDRSRDAVVWHPSAATAAVGGAVGVGGGGGAAAELFDPLGFGRIDTAAMRLDRDNGREASSAGKGSAIIDTGLGQANRGAMGRFFGELLANPRLTGASPGAAGTALARRGGAAGTESSRGGGGPDAPPPMRRRSSTAAGRAPPAAAAVPLERILPGTSAEFDAAAYLATFHAGASAGDLEAGLAALERGLGERQGQLQTLVRQNFDRFTGCRTAIDDIYAKLRRIEEEEERDEGDGGKGRGGGRGKGAAAGGGGGGMSTAVLLEAVEEAQAAAQRAFGPMLERHAQAERVKSVRLLLRRFQPLFAMPARVRSLAAERDYEGVCAEYRRANALVAQAPSSSSSSSSSARPGGAGGQGGGGGGGQAVWSRLREEVEARVTEAWRSLEAELRRSDLPAADAPELLLHALALRAEGLPEAQGKDPVATLLEAREARFRADMATAAERRARGMARLRERYCAAAAAEGRAVEAAARVTDAELLRWGQGEEDGCGGGGDKNGGCDESPGASASAGGGMAAARAAGGGGGGLRSLARTAGGVAAQAPQSLGARLAPLSGLVPPPLRSRLVRHSGATPGEQLVLGHAEAVAAALRFCLPSFWAVASSPRLLASKQDAAAAASADHLPREARADLRQSVKAAGAAAQRLIEAACREMRALATALADVGPLRPATLSVVQLLARTVTALREELKAPPASVDAAASVLRDALEAGVRRVADHLESLPGRLAAREAWVVSLAHSHTGEAPVTRFPEWLQEEVTVAVRFYESLASAAAPALGGRPPADVAVRPLHLAFFACLGGCTARLSELAERFDPQQRQQEEQQQEEQQQQEQEQQEQEQEQGARRPSRGPSRMALLLAADVSDDEGGGGEDGGDGGGAPKGAALSLSSSSPSGVGVGGVPGVSDDVRLLLVASNLSQVRTRLVGSLTQRFLLALTGEQASEVERVGRTVKGLAKRMDSALRAMYSLYSRRRRARLDRLLDAYARPSATGAPPELRDVTPGARALLQALARSQADAYTYARPHASFLLGPLMEHVASGLAARFASIRADEAPPEGLAQRFLDLSWLDGVLGGAGPAAMRADVDAAYALLSRRIAESVAASQAARAEGRDGPGGLPPMATPLAASLAAVRDPAQLNDRLQATCRKLLPDILGRSTFTLRSFLAQ